MSKHTQWITGLGYEQAEIGFWISDSKGEIILSDDVKPSDDVLALIAAAPELLEAAQEAMRLLELLSILAQDGKEIYKHELRSDIELFTKRIALAIAKASGEKE